MKEQNMVVGRWYCNNLSIAPDEQFEGFSGEGREKLAKFVRTSVSDPSKKYTTPVTMEDLETWIEVSVRGMFFMYCAATSVPLAMSDSSDMLVAFSKYVSSLEDPSIKDLSTFPVMHSTFEYHYRHISEKGMLQIAKGPHARTLSAYAEHFITKQKKAKTTTPEKQVRYLTDNGEDLIDRWARDRTPEEFRVIMFAMVEKYNTRLGKKDSVVKEVGKMADYMHRWHQYEKGWEGTHNG